MSLSLQCPFCQSRLKIPEKLAGTKVRCPKCESQILAPVEQPQPTRRRRAEPAPNPVPEPSYASAPPRSTFVPDGQPTSLPGRTAPEQDHKQCPTCEALLFPNADVCHHCGHSFRKTKRRKRKKTSFTLDLQPGMRKNLQPASWADIYETPFDVENVVTESIMLSVWNVVYFFLFLALLTPLIHPIFTFCMLLAFANYLRILIVHKDVQLTTILICGGAFFGAWFLGAQILSRMLNIETQSIGGLAVYVMVFYFLAYLCLILRMISHFFGKYFAICNRSAYGAMVSEDDRGGFIDLGYALVVMFFAFAPLVVGMIVAAVVGVTVGNSVASWLFLAAAMLPLLGWAYFYFPMGATVAAIEYSVNPLRVLHWCTVCFWDYVKLLLLFVPFFVIVTAVSYLTGAFLVGVLPAVSFVPKELFLLFNTFIVSNFFNQYIFVVGYTALGLIARMHESELGWRSN